MHNLGAIKNVGIFKKLSYMLRDAVKSPQHAIRRLLSVAYLFIYPDKPWIAPKVVNYLQSKILKEETGFEWGSGNSTLWFAMHSKKLISVEHNLKWFNNISERLKKKNLLNVDYRYVKLDHDESLPTVPVYTKQPQYIAQITDFKDSYFDYCLVDGHYRQACILAAIPKLKPGAPLIVDDIQWLPFTKWGVPTNWQVVIKAKKLGGGETVIWEKAGH